MTRMDGTHACTCGFLEQKYFAHAQTHWPQAIPPVLEATGKVKKLGCNAGSFRVAPLR